MERINLACADPRDLYCWHRAYFPRSGLLPLGGGQSEYSSPCRCCSGPRRSLTLAWAMTGAAPESSSSAVLF